MKIYRILSLALVVFLLAACNGQANPGNIFNPVTPPGPQVSVTRPAEPQGTLETFLQAWKNDDYASMYTLLTQDSQKSISAEDFAKRYGDAMDNLTLKELVFSVGAPSQSFESATIPFSITYKTNMVGDLQRDITATLKREGDQWRIAWEEGMILPELRGGNHLEMDISVPQRGTIYDRNGNAVVTQSDAMSIALVPGQIDPETEGSLLANLSGLVGLYPGTIQGLYASAGPDWYIPVGEASLDDFNHYYGVLLGFSGVKWNQYNTRLYSNNIAPQAIGYVSSIQPDELSHYLRLGYSRAQLVGRIGIEKWAENTLAGKNGGTLHVIGPDGAVISQLGNSPEQPASNVYLTIDKNLEYETQKAIEGFRGAAVVIERDTGRVLAIASSPGYDPNLFDPKNLNSPNGISALFSDTTTPLIDRATQSKYPLGSVFKVMTFSAALESGTYTPDSKLDCPYEFTELTDKIRYDWTWEHFQDELLATGEGHTRPSGMLTLSQALMRSCNPWFWHIGLDLYRQGRVTAVADMARGFGLGAPTGIGEIEEDAGTINNPPGEVEAVNQAIGQGDVQVTPLQVARLMAAIGNGGSLYRPQMVEKIVDANGIVTQVFKPDQNANPLPITSQTLDALRAAMKEVIRNPRGTAYVRFYNMKDIDIYGKTGTAESGNGRSHAWFAGYTNENRTDKPDIAIAVIAENAGEGSQIAAPIFKRIVEVYFYGHPRSPYPWETSIGVTRTPTFPVTPTSGFINP